MTIIRKFKFSFTFIEIYLTQHSISLRYTHNNLTYIYCKMITTISLVNIHHLVRIQKKRYIFSCDENFCNLLSKQLSNLPCNSVNYSHHFIHYFATTYLSYNWKFVRFDHLNLLHPPKKLLI